MPTYIHTYTRGLRDLRAAYVYMYIWSMYLCRSFYMYIIKYKSIYLQYIPIWRTNLSVVHIYLSAVHIYLQYISIYSTYLSTVHIYLYVLLSDLYVLHSARRMRVLACANVCVYTCVCVHTVADSGLVAVHKHVHTHVHT